MPRGVEIIETLRERYLAGERVTLSRPPTKEPPACAGGHVHSAGLNLPADVDAGSTTTETATATSAASILDHKLDPQ